MMHDHDDDSHVYVPRDERPSRSQLRREALDVLKLAQALAALSDAQLARIPLDDDLRAEVASTRAVKQQIARKRAEQFLAKQLRKLDDADLEPMRAALEHDREHARREAAALQRGSLRWHHPDPAALPGLAAPAARLTATVNT